jgi:magnesium transporter
VTGVATHGRFTFHFPLFTFHYPQGEPGMDITVFGEEGMSAGEADDITGLLGLKDKTIWFDIGPQDDDEWPIITRLFRFHPLAVADVKSKHKRPKLDEYGDHLYLILNPVGLKGNRLAFRQLDVFVGQHYVVTVHRREEPVVGEMRERLGLARPGQPVTAAYLLYLVLDTVVDTYFPVMDGFSERLEDLEDEIMSRPGESSLRTLFRLKRRLADIRRTAWPQHEILSTLLRHDIPFLASAELKYQLRDVSDHLFWIIDMSNISHETLTAVMDLYMSGVSNQLNRVVSRLTTFTVIIGILTLINGIYSTNFQWHWPDFSAPWGIPFLLSLLIGAASLVLFLFRRLGWY